MPGIRVFPVFDHIAREPIFVTKFFLIAADHVALRFGGLIYGLCLHRFSSFRFDTLRFSASNSF